MNLETITITLEDNTIITGFKGDHITKILLSTKSYYEHNMLNFIKNSISKGIMIDVGGNIGNHTLFLSKYCATKVITFEPYPITYEILERNIIQNNITNVQLMNLGLSNQPKEVLMSAPSDNIGMARINEKGTEWVKVIPFDSYWKSEEPITLIKIDCEGYEINTVMGMLEVIKQDKPALFIECQTNEDIINMRKLLFPLGYKDLYRFNSTPTYYFLHKGK